MIGLARELEKIDGIEHTIYADDITIWATSGCEGDIEQALQLAVDTIESYLLPTGLRCSPAKSELLLYRPVRRGRKPSDWQESRQSITLHTSCGTEIPKVKHIRVLGMIIEENGTNSVTVNKLVSKTNNAIRLLKRVANKHNGVKEDNLIRLVHSFVLCHFSYIAAMHNWYRSERDKLNALIRKAIKSAIGIPCSTSTARLLQLGIHNTLEEIAEAQERSQITRLSSSVTGRHILKKLGYTEHSYHGDSVEIPPSFRELITATQIPRNVHPEHNYPRRRARAATILRNHQHDIKACFVDAASYRSGLKFTAVVINHKGELTNCTSLYTKDPLVAEQVAIALAIVDDTVEVIFSDSRSAIRSFANGRISPQALRILQNSPKELCHHTLIWFPAHVGQIPGCPVNLNESAHSAARVLTDRTDTGRFEAVENRDVPSTYNEITKHFYLSRRVFPPPSPKLSRPQALTLRLLQTESYPNPHVLHAIYPELYDNDICNQCKLTPATLKHMLWECTTMYHDVNPDATSARWAAALCSSSLADQKWAVQQAHDAAVRLGLSVPTWEP